MNSEKVLDILEFHASRNHLYARFNSRNLTVIPSELLEVAPMPMYQPNIHFWDLPKDAAAQAYYGWLQPIKQPPVLSFYFSESQKSMLLKHYDHLPMVFDGNEFVPYTECSLTPSAFADSRVICRFEHGETYRVQWSPDSIDTFIVR